MSHTLKNKITVINFIMTILILCYHFPIFNFGSNYLVCIMKDNLGFLAMATFFLISGFLLYRNAETIDDAKNKIKRRFYSLFIPYIIWNIIAIIAHGSIEKLTFSKLVKWFFTGPANGSLWYLLALYLLSFFSLLVVKFKNNKKYLLSIFTLIVVYLYLKNINIIPAIFNAESWWWYYNVLGYLPYYILGCCTGLYLKDSLLEVNSNIIISFISFIIFIIAFCFKIFISFFVLDFILVLSFWYMLPCKWFKSNIKLLTENSFFLYVMHIPILIPLTTKIMNLVFTGYYINIGWFILMYSFAIFTMLIIEILIVSILKLLFIKSNKAFLILSGNRVENNFIKNKKLIKQ